MSECYVEDWKLINMQLQPLSRANGLTVEFRAGDHTAVRTSPELPENFQEMTIQQLAEIGAEQAKKDI
ncbi:hypothetical protein QWY79_10170 [Halomonas sabkhae]|uniref:hypothetical protein n=1 Tax=Halomonas sabkhae TaxID=626223 RepID=UPI0025B4B545|nr:hypothetical protein [Halomonas sabkhae]MDN3525629.1 hypothetical protein [Halomonas sabkhae]